MANLTKIISANVSYDIKDATAVNKIELTTVSITTSAWTTLSSDDGSGCFGEGYIYRAAITNANITSSHFPEVVFGVTEALSGIYAPVAMTYSGGVYIYANRIPTTTITIPTVICLK